MRVRMIADYKVSDRFTAKKGKYGSFDSDVAKKMIKDKCAIEVKETQLVTREDLLKLKKPYIAPEKELNPTAAKKKEADKKPEPEKSGKKTKEEKKF